MQLINNVVPSKWLVTDNRAENLQLLTAKEHAAIHYSENLKRFSWPVGKRHTDKSKRKISESQRKRMAETAKHE